MSERTPGPWHVIPPRRGLESRAVVGASIGADIYNAPLTEETMANARLIASAPDLLDALDGMVRLVSTYPAYFHADEVNMRAWLDMARATISKARTPTPSEVEP